MEGNECIAQFRKPYCGSFKVIYLIILMCSESMTPAFERGDLLFLAMTAAPLKVGDIAVYKIKGQPIPIVHRVLEVHEK